MRSEVFIVPCKRKQIDKYCERIKLVWLAMKRKSISNRYVSISNSTTKFSCTASSIIDKKKKEEPQAGNTRTTQ